MSSATCVCGWLVRCSFTVKKNLLGDKIRKKSLALALEKKKKCFWGPWPKTKIWPNFFFFFSKNPNVPKHLISEPLISQHHHHHRGQQTNPAVILLYVIRYVRKAGARGAWVIHTDESHTYYENTGHETRRSRKKCQSRSPH